MMHDGTSICADEHDDEDDPDEHETLTGINPPIPWRLDSSSGSGLGAVSKTCHGLGFRVYRVYKP